MTDQPVELDYDSQHRVCVLVPYGLARAVADAAVANRQVRAFFDCIPVWEMDGGGEPIRFLNHYDCPCGCHWTDAWSATCDDDCPKCETTCSPTKSEDIEPLAPESD